MDVKRTGIPLLMMVLWGACTPQEDPEPVVTGTFEARGVVVRILENSRLLQIDHGDVDGFMPAMTMPFEYRTDSIRNAIEMGDSVHFRIATDGISNWITSIRVIESD